MPSTTLKKIGDTLNLLKIIINKGVIMLSTKVLAVINNEEIINELVMFCLRTKHVNKNTVNIPERLIKLTIIPFICDGKRKSKKNKALAINK